MGKIYHYTRFETAIEHILPNMMLRTNYLDAMNDPKENQLWAFGGVNIPYKEIYPTSYCKEMHWQHQCQLGHDIRKSMQALSFVRDGNGTGFLNEMMWAHYTNNHRGVCLEIDRKLILETNGPYIGKYSPKMKEIQYLEHDSPYIHWNQNISKDENLKNIALYFADQFLFLKSPYWEREAEERLLLFECFEPTFLSIRSSLTAIYLGLEFPNEYFPAISRLIDPDTTKFYEPVFQLNKLDFEERPHNEFRPVITKGFSDTLKRMK